MLLGAHVSTAGGMRNAVHQGLDLECEAIQVFTRNQRQWEPKALDGADAAVFRREAREADFLSRSVSHASYLINLCATDPRILERSRSAFVDEIERCALLGIPYLCVHPGSHLGAGEEAGLAGIAESVRHALQRTRGRRVMVLLENTAGQGTNLGHDLGHLRALRRAIKSRRVGFCIDTCHLFASGHDLRTRQAYDTSMETLVAALGLENIRAFHLNDSKHACGSRRDRHEHIGQGCIGPGAFRRLVRDPRFRDLPGLLETPGGPEGYKENLDRLRRMRGKTR
ncbi:MAG: deoxyribonuclease IV [Planctomycetota bacterium]